MKLRGDITINGRCFSKGTEVPWFSIYPFFLFHMLMFGVSGFVMAYSTPGAPLPFLYLHGGFAILIYTVFYLTIFGLDEVKWMFINAGLGLLGIYTQIGWLLRCFGKNIDDYPLSRHVTPLLYFVLYTFLVRHAILDITQAREDPAKKNRVEVGYIVVAVAVSLLAFCLQRG